MYTVQYSYCSLKFPSDQARDEAAARRKAVTLEFCSRIFIVYLQRFRFTVHGSSSPTSVTLCTMKPGLTVLNQFSGSSWNSNPPKQQTEALMDESDGVNHLR